jgi:hypothetical protein
LEIPLDFRKRDTVLVQNDVMLINQFGHVSELLRKCPHLFGEGCHWLA